MFLGIIGKLRYSIFTYLKENIIMSIEVGDSIKDLSLPDGTNTFHNINEYLDKKLVLAFFPGAFTGVCTEELCTLDGFTGQLESLNAQVIGITVDSTFVLKNWAAQNNVQITLLSDCKKEWIKYFGVEFTGLGGVEGYISANRAVFIVEPGGKVSYKWIAESPGIQPNYEEIKKLLNA
jgi:peroxiredoxin